VSQPVRILLLRQDTGIVRFFVWNIYAESVGVPDKEVTPWPWGCGLAALGYHGKEMRVNAMETMLRMT
jgi:hypothetical protein